MDNNKLFKIIRINNNRRKIEEIKQGILTFFLDVSIGASFALLCFYIAFKIIEYAKTT
jgi:hypothetical protein